jgi:hypothetical protein
LSDSVMVADGVKSGRALFRGRAAVIGVKLAAKVRLTAVPPAGVVTVSSGLLYLDFDADDLFPLVMGGDRKGLSFGGAMVLVCLLFWRISDFLVRPTFARRPCKYETLLATQTGLDVFGYHKLCQVVVVVCCRRQSTMGKGSNVQKKQTAQLRNQKDKSKSDEERKAATDKAK